MAQNPKNFKILLGSSWKEINQSLLPHAVDFKALNEFNFHIFSNFYEKFNCLRFKCRTEFLSVDNYTNDRMVTYSSYFYQCCSHLHVTFFRNIRNVLRRSVEWGQLHLWEALPAWLYLPCICYSFPNKLVNVGRPNCQSSLFHLWESLLQEVESDSQSQGEVANVFARQVSRPLLDRSFHRKVQARKIFGHRDSFEIIINKAEEKLAKVKKPPS